MFHNFQNYDSYLILQEVGNYNFKTTVISKTLPKKKEIKPGIPLIFIDSIHILNNLLDNLVINLG